MHAYEHNYSTRSSGNNTTLTTVIILKKLMRKDEFDPLDSRQPITTKSVTIDYICGTNHCSKRCKYVQEMTPF